MAYCSEHNRDFIALCIDCVEDRYGPIVGADKPANSLSGRVYEATKATLEAATNWQDEPTEPSGDPDCATCGTPKSFHQVFTNTNDKTAWCRGGRYEGHSYSAPVASTQGNVSMLDNAIFHADQELPHGIVLSHERKLAWRSYEVSATCPHCGKSELTSTITDNMLTDTGWTDVLVGLLVEGVRNVKPACISATCCDPLDRMVDGLTVREALARYQTRMNECGLADYDERYWDMKSDVIRKPIGNAEAVNAAVAASWEREGVFPRGFRLNDAQLAAARLAWSASLRAKQAEQREKERNVVCVDDDRWEL